jgi:hypothetical protein
MKERKSGPVLAIKTLLKSFLWHSDSNCTEKDWVLLKLLKKGCWEFSCGRDQDVTRGFHLIILCCPRHLGKLSVCPGCDRTKLLQKHPCPTESIITCSPRICFLLWPE